MTNDQRLDGFHNYRFEMYCADQAEITSLRTQLAEVARERDQWAKKWKTSLDTYGENLIARGDEIDSLRHDRDVLMGQLGNTKIKLEAATEERDRLRAALIDCAVPLEVLHAIDCELAPATQAGITAAIAAIRSALFSAQPEPKPLTPADRVMIALAGRDKDDAERTLDKMYPKPEPKPEAPKCAFCGGRGPHPMSAFDKCTTCGTGRAQ